MRDSEKNKLSNKEGALLMRSPVYVTKIQIDEQDNQE